MNRLEIAKRVRSYTRDFSSSIFRTVDVLDYINEGVQRCREVIPELINMVLLVQDTDEPQLLPAQYHHLLAVYSASRCFSQDERHYQAVQLMNEFENKLDELHSRIMDGSVVIKDALGNTVQDTSEPDYVNNIYFTKSSEEDEEVVY